MGSLLGGFPSEETLDHIGFSRFVLEKLALYELAGIMGEIGLLLAVWYGQNGWDRGWDRGRMEGPTLAGAGSGAPPLSLEVRSAVSGRRRGEVLVSTNFVMAARAQSIFVTVVE